MRLARQRLSAAFLGAAVILVVAGSQLRCGVAKADTTPGMLFGPLRVEQGQHVELCSTYLSDGTLTQLVHFRNLTTGEVTTPVTLTVASGGGACATYSGKGHVVGMARAGSPESASDWVSLSNALIGTMSVVDDGGGARVAIPGIAKFWLSGL
jgi:hypothetical protein